MQDVEVRMPQAHPGVRHVAGLDGLGRRARFGESLSDHEIAVVGEDRVGALVPGDTAVALGAERDDAAGESARGRSVYDMVADRERPFAVEVELARRAVAVPLPFCGTAFKSAKRRGARIRIAQPRMAGVPVVPKISSGVTDISNGNLHWQYAWIDLLALPSGNIYGGNILGRT